MTIDPHYVGRAAEQLDNALRLATSAQELEVPWLLRRSFTTDVVKSTLGDAADWARSASQELTAAGQGVDDARAATDALATQLEAARGGDVVKTRGAQPLQDAVEGARNWQAGLARIGDGAKALDEGSAREWFLRTLDASAEPGPVLAARTLSDAPAAHELGLAQSFLSRLDPNDARSVELARIALADGGAAASSALLDDLVAAAERHESIDSSLLRSALTGLDDGATNAGTRLPDWLAAADAPATSQLDDIDIAQVDLLRGLRDPNALAADAHATVSRPLAELGRADAVRIAAMGELPAAIRPNLPESAVDAVDLATALRANQDPTPQLLRMWAGGITTEKAAAKATTTILDGNRTQEAAHRLGALAADRPTAVFGASAPDAWRTDLAGALRAADDDTAADVLLDAVRTTRAKPAASALDTEASSLLQGELDTTKLRRLAALAKLPDGVRPATLDNMADTLVDAARTGATGSLDDIRWIAERESIVADPDGKLRAVKALETLLERPNEQLDMSDLRRVQRIGELPEAVRPEMPGKVGSYGLADHISNAWLPGSDSDSKAWFNELRWGIERQRLTSDPSITKASLTRDLDTMLAKPDADVTMDDLRRLAMLDELPGNIKPELPGKASSYSRRDLYRNSWLPGSDSDARAEFANLRIHREGARMVEDPTVTRETTTAEALAIIDKPNADVTGDDVKRLALFEQLPAGRRPELPSKVSRTMSELHRTGALPASDDGARAEFEALRNWRLAGRLESDPAITRETLRADLDGILAKPDADITADDLRRVIAMDRIGGNKRVELPHKATSYTRDQLLANNWLPGSDSDARGEFANLRAWRERERLIEDPNVTRATLTADLDAMLAKPDADVTMEDLRRLAMLDDLPSNLRPELPGKASSYSRSELYKNAWLPGGDGDARREFANLRIFRGAQAMIENPNITRESTTAEAMAIIDKPMDQVTMDDLKRLSLFEELPAGRRPQLPGKSQYTMRQLYGNGWLPGADSDARKEFEALRSWREATKLDADPAVTRATLRADLEAILAKPNEEVTIDDLRRIVQMERVTDAKRVVLPGKASSYTRQALLDNGWLPGSDSDARKEFTSLRNWLQRDQLAHDPSVTRESLTDEVARIALKPDAEITQADLDRIVLLEGLPANLRPSLPSRASNYSRADLAASAWLPASDSDARLEFASLRRWATLETDTGRQVARERVQAGVALDPLTLAALARGGEAELASVGLTSEDLLRSTLQSLRDAPPTDLHGINEGMQLAKELIDSMPRTSATRDVAEEASALFDKNIRRIAGKVGGGYSNNPDFAELGRAIEQAELIASIRAAEHAPAPAAAEAPAAVADAAQGADAVQGVDIGTAGEHLSW